MKLAVGISGASGAIIGLRLIEELARQQHECQAIITEQARGVIKEEVGEWKFPATVTVYSAEDHTAPLNSSSTLVDAMVVAPCSLKSLAAIATGYCNNLLIRASVTMIRMNKPLVICARETPLPASALEHMLNLRRERVIILPPCVGYYTHPLTIDDVTNFFVGKILDQLGIAHSLYKPWKAQ